MKRNFFHQAAEIMHGHGELAVCYCASALFPTAAKASAGIAEKMSLILS